MKLSVARSKTNSEAMNMQTTQQHPLYSERLNSEGFPLLVLHGWGQSSAAIKPLGELLQRCSQVHLIDLPGFGQSAAPDHPWSSFDYADRLIAYLDEHQIKQVDLLGHSFGGKVAMSLAIRYPQRVRRLILISASGLRKKRTILQRTRSTAIKWSGKGLKWIDQSFSTKFFAERFAPRYGSVDYQRASGVMRSILVRSVNEDLSDQVKQIKAPTLLLWGEKDSETPFEIAMRLNKLISASRLLPLPHKGHYPFEGVGSHLCAYQIVPFLGDVDG